MRPALTLPFRVKAHARAWAFSFVTIRSLRNREPNRLRLGISSRRRRHRNGVIARRGAAHRGLRLAAAARRDEQWQGKQRAQHQDPKDPSPTTITAYTHECDPGNDEPDRVETSREDARSRRDDRAGSCMDGQRDGGSTRTGQTHRAGAGTTV